MPCNQCVQKFKPRTYRRASSSSSFSRNLCSISVFKWFRAAWLAWYFCSISRKASSASCKADAKLSRSASSCERRASKSVSRRFASRRADFSSLTWSARMEKHKRIPDQPTSIAESRGEKYLGLSLPVKD